MHIPKIQEELSWVPVKLKVCVNGIEVAVATGFFYEHQGKAFLITNYHVVSGRHPISGKILTACGLCPDSLIVSVVTEEPRNADTPDGAKMMGWRHIKLPLYTDDDKAEPIWVVHPRHGSAVDVVAIELNWLANIRTIAANSTKLGLKKLRIYPSMDAFVLGFPKGMSGGAHLPIWKRATIANEPDFHLDGLPKFYIDTATREGMSGAPVYAQEVGFVKAEGAEKDDWAIGKGLRFVGIYSGRLGAEDEFQVQLGLVWNESSLIEIVEAAIL